jgi:hypothetical protein
LAISAIKIDKPLDEVIQRWKTNRDLVYLHTSCIPNDVCNSMFESIENNTKSLSGSEIHSILDKEKILQGTTYTKEKKTEFNESGLFKSISESVSDVKIIDKKESSFDGDFWDNLIK